MTRRLTLPLLALAMSAFSACRDNPAPAAAAPASSPTGQPAASARTPWVAARDPQTVALLEAPAQVLAAPSASASISPPFPARIQKILVRAGERVAIGAPVAQVVMPRLVETAGQLASARTRVAGYARRKEQLDQLRGEGLVRLQESSEVEMRLAESRADEEHAVAVLRSAGFSAAEGARLIESGGSVALRTPVEGVVTEVDGAIGEQRDAGGRPIVRVVGDAPPRIEAHLAHRLPPRARFEFITATGERHALKLVSQAPLVDTRDATTPAWFETDPEVPLRQGLPGRLRIVLLDTTQVAAVPSAAVGIEEGHPFVLVREGDAGRRVPVEVLAASGSETLVKGIPPSTQVAAEAPPGERGAPE